MDSGPWKESHAVRPLGRKEEPNKAVVAPPWPGDQVASALGHAVRIRTLDNIVLRSARSSLSPKLLPSRFPRNNVPLGSHAMARVWPTCLLDSRLVHAEAKVSQT
jgi:hypothetical protein